MGAFFDYLKSQWGFAQQHPELAFLLLVVGYGIVMIGFFAAFAGPVTWVERRVAGRMQCRIGPNRVGPQGFLQWLADGLKNFLKEDLIPNEADRVLFRLAVYPVFAGVFLTFVVLPFGPWIVGADLDVGLVYLLAVTALVVTGIIMAGWASNNKWSLLGGIRSAAQMVSYEVAAGMALLTAIVPVGSLSLQGMIEHQGGWPWQWTVFYSPATFLAFFVYFTASLAEGNRTPFDLPEAESELVAGYNTEYSGMRFLFFAFAEWGNLYVIGAVITAVFLGGWRIPGVSLSTQVDNVWLQFAGAAIFILKASILVFVTIWVRWTLPRLRVDQLMMMCWKYFVPIGMGLVVLSLVWQLLAAAVPTWVTTAVSVLLTLVGGALVVAMFWRTWYNIRASKDTPVYKWFI